MSAMVRLLLTLLIPVAHAQLTPPPSCGFSTGDVHWDCLGDYIGMLTGFVVTLAATIGLLMVMVNGFRYMVGPAIEGSTDSAKKGILHALLGTAVALLAYIILDTIIKHATGS